MRFSQNTRLFSTMAMTLITMLGIASCNAPQRSNIALEKWQTERAASSALSRIDGVCDGWGYNYADEVLFEDDVVRNIVALTPCTGYASSDSGELLHWGLTTALSLGPDRPTESVSFRLENNFPLSMVDDWRAETAKVLGNDKAIETIYVQEKHLFARMTPEQAEEMVGQKWPVDPPKIPRDLFVQVDQPSKDG